ncbi:receptor-type tyrosine-protein phosphatase t, partial [Biomphalaria glabrata]
MFFKFTFYCLRVFLFLSVHSNGAHRTGLLIALDSLFTQWEVTSTIDVVCCVVRMREDRVGFFPTE